MSRPYRFEKTVFSDAHDKLVSLLKNARKEANLTQVQVAESLNCSQIFLSRIESGDQKIDVIEFLVMARVYGIDPKTIIEELIPLAEGIIPKE